MSESKLLRYEACPVCAEKGLDTTGDNLAVYDDGHSHCFACGHQEQPKGRRKISIAMPCSAELPTQGWSKKGLSVDTLERFGVTRLAVLDEEGLPVYREGSEPGSHIPVGTATLAFPYFDIDTGKLSAYKKRDLSAPSKKEGMSWVGHNDKVSLFGLSAVPVGATTVVLTEGESDTMSVAQAYPEAAVLGISGASSVKLSIQRSSHYLRKFKKIVVCFDNDEAGVKAADEAIALLPKGKSYRATVPSKYKDINEVLIEEGAEAVRNIVRNATQVRSSNIVGSEELLQTTWSHLLNKDKNSIGASTGFASLDKAIGGLAPGKLVTIVSGTGVGKDIPLDASIFSPSKGLVQVKDLEVGDTVVGSDGKPTEVVALSDIWTDQLQYKVTFDDGVEVVCGGNHLWTVNALSGRSTNRRTKKTLSTKEMLELGLRSEHGRKMFSVDITPPVELPEASLPIHPYLLGQWLGDGDTCDGVITTSDFDVIRRCEELSGFVAKESKSTTCPRYRFKDLKQALRDVGVLGHKHIPLSYKLASIEQRMYLLQGLLDSDGYAGKTSVEFCTILPELAKDVAELVRSLGMKVTVRENGAYLYGRYISQRYRLDIRAASKDIFWLERKKVNVYVKQQNCNRVRYITNITALDVVPSRCLQVSNSDGLFLCGGLDFVLTHNSMLCENIAVNAVMKHDDVKVLFLPLEMSNQQVLERMAQSITGLPIVADPFFTMEMGRSDEAKLKSAVEKVTDKILFPRQDKTINVAHFVELVEEAVEVYGVEVVVLDHITALSVNEKDGLDWRSIDRTMAKLKELAVRLKVCVLTVSHISRDGENEDEVPKLKHIRAGNGIAQYSDVVLGMGRERSQNDTTVETIKLDRMLGRYVKFVLTYSNFKLVEKDDAVYKTEVDSPYAEKTDISTERSLRQPAGKGSSLDVSKPGTSPGHSTSVGGVQETQVSPRLRDREGRVPGDERLHGTERPRKDTSGVRTKPIDRLTAPVLVTPPKDKLDK